MLPLLLIVAQMRPDVPPDVQDVFVSGRMDARTAYDTFRIPAICRTRSGTLLAFAEGRRSVSDQAANVLVLRRRTRNSKEWGPLEVVAKDEPAALNNPCVIATRGGRIWLTYQRYPEKFNERSVVPGFDPTKSCLTFVIFSDDDGKKWSAPRDISSVVKSGESQSDASGPGCGIELRKGPHKGRLIFPFNEGAKGKYNVYCVYSDDKGKTWTRGKTPAKDPEFQPNETQIVECADGSILMNCRNQASGRFRLQCRSEDGGVTWSAIEPRRDLVDPVCQGSIVRLNDARGTLVLSNPADAKARVNGTLRVSLDSGRTWSAGKSIVPGSFAYSVLCPLDRNRVGVLYESVDDLGGGREGYRIRYFEVAVEP